MRVRCSSLRRLCSMIDASSSARLKQKNSLVRRARRCAAAQIWAPVVGGCLLPLFHSALKSGVVGCCLVQAVDKLSVTAKVRNRHMKKQRRTSAQTNQNNKYAKKTFASHP
jgi:uncharacterized protein (DUF2062 family)